MHLTVRLADAHIAAGTPRSCMLCPIARAVHDAVGVPCTVTVSGCAGILVCLGPERWGGDLPAAGLDFIRRFDMGLAVAEMEFAVELRRVA